MIRGMSTLAPTKPGAIGIKWFRALDVAYLDALTRFGKWWKQVWGSCMYYVRRSNAWPKPLEDDRGRP